MKPGSVIVDLAVPQGGNVEGGSVADRGRRAARRQASSAMRTCPRMMPADASALFARNLFNFLSAFWDKESRAMPGAR
jgi:NAD(P) transhydrogenase subunit alpha